MDGDDLDTIKRQRAWEKFQELPSMLPDKLLWKLETSK